jgi:hypothetical protein
MPSMPGLGVLYVTKPEAAAPQVLAAVRLRVLPTKDQITAAINALFATPQQLQISLPVYHILLERWEMNGLTEIIETDPDARQNPLP